MRATTPLALAALLLVPFIGTGCGASSGDAAVTDAGASIPDGWVQDPSRPQPDAQPADSQADAEAEADSGADPDSGADADSAAGSDSEAEAGADPEADSGADAEADSGADPGPDGDADAEPETGPAPDAEIEPGSLEPLVTLTLQEPAGVARAGAPVRSGVPLPQGLVASKDALALSAAGGPPLPLQTRVLSTWPDGTVRWVLLDTFVDLEASETLSLTLSKAESDLPAPEGLSITETAALVTVDTGPLVVEIPTSDGRLIHSLSVDGVQLVAPEGAPTERGAWVSLAGGDTYYSSLLSASDTAEGTAMAAYRDWVADFDQEGDFNLYDPHDLSVTVEDAGPLHAVIRVSGAHRSVDGQAFGTFITRIHAFAGSRQLQIQHTFVFTGDDDDQIASYGVRLPIGAADALTLVEGEPASSGEVRHLSYQGHEILGEPQPGQALGWVAREGAGASLTLTLPELAEAFPKALSATPSGLEAQLYAAAAEPWDLSRYEDGVNGPGESSTEDNRGAQGLARTDWIGLHLSTAALEPTEAQALAAADDAGPLMLVAPPEWVSGTEVMGVGPFHFDPSPASEAHYRIDRLLHVVADFMRYNQRVQFHWFGIEDYGDIRGRFSGGGPPFEWFLLGRYGWSGNSGEPSNQLWIQYLRRPSRAVLTDAIALARHTMDVQMVHYADRESTGGSVWGGKNKEFSVGSLHRHGQQAWSGYAGFPQYAHVAGVETYYYLTGDERARETLYETAQFISRYGPTTPSYTALNNGVDVLARAAAVFWDHPQLAKRFSDRASYLLDWIADGQLIPSIEDDGLFSFFLRGTPGLMYHHALTGDPRGAEAVLEAATWMTAGGGDTLGLAESPSAAGQWYEIGTLAYAKAVAPDFGVDPAPFQDLLAAIFALQLHDVESADSGAISLASLAAIPEDWRDWTWEWDEDPLDPDAPGILWIDRQISFRNDYMQDYHSYRAFLNLAVMAAALPPE